MADRCFLQRRGLRRRLVTAAIATTALLTNVALLFAQHRVSFSACDGWIIHADL